jgi:hypothetical protein
MKRKKNKGTVKRKLTWVKSGINRNLAIWACAATIVVAYCGAPLQPL